MRNGPRAPRHMLPVPIRSRRSQRGASPHRRSVPLSASQQRRQQEAHRSPRDRECEKRRRESEHVAAEMPNATRQPTTRRTRRATHPPHCEPLPMANLRACTDRHGCTDTRAWLTMTAASPRSPSRGALVRRPCTRIPFRARGTTPAATAGRHARNPRGRRARRQTGSRGPGTPIRRDIAGVRRHEQRVRAPRALPRTRTVAADEHHARWPPGAPRIASCASPSRRSCGHSARARARRRAAGDRRTRSAGRPPGSSTVASGRTVSKRSTRSLAFRPVRQKSWAFARPAAGARADPAPVAPSPRPTGASTDFA